MKENKNVILPVIKLKKENSVGFHDPLTPDEFSNLVNLEVSVIGGKTDTLRELKFYMSLFLTKKSRKKHFRSFVLRNYGNCLEK